MSKGNLRKELLEKARRESAERERIKQEHKDRLADAIARAKAQTAAATAKQSPTGPRNRGSNGQTNEEPQNRDLDNQELHKASYVHNVIFGNKTIEEFINRISGVPSSTRNNPFFLNGTLVFSDFKENSELKKLPILGSYEQNDDHNASLVINSSTKDGALLLRGFPTNLNSDTFPFASYTDSTLSEMEFTMAFYFKKKNFPTFTTHWGDVTYESFLEKLLEKTLYKSADLRRADYSTTKYYTQNSEELQGIPERSHFIKNEINECHILTALHHIQAVVVGRKTDGNQLSLFTALALKDRITEARQTALQDPEQLEKLVKFEMFKVQSSLEKLVSLKREQIYLNYNRTPETNERMALSFRNKGWKNFHFKKDDPRNYSIWLKSYEEYLEREITRVEAEISEHNEYFTDPRKTSDIVTSIKESANQYSALRKIKLWINENVSKDKIKTNVRRLLSNDIQLVKHDEKEHLFRPLSDAEKTLDFTQLTRGQSENNSDPNTLKKLIELRIFHTFQKQLTQHGKAELNYDEIIQKIQDPKIINSILVNTIAADYSDLNNNIIKSILKHHGLREALLINGRTYEEQKKEITKFITYATKNKFDDIIDPLIEELTKVINSNSQEPNNSKKLLQEEIKELIKISSTLNNHNALLNLCSRLESLCSRELEDEESEYEESEGEELEDGRTRPSYNTMIVELLPEDSNPEVLAVLIRKKIITQDEIYDNIQKITKIAMNSNDEEFIRSFIKDSCEEIRYILTQIVRERRPELLKLLTEDNIKKINNPNSNITFYMSLYCSDFPMTEDLLNIGVKPNLKELWEYDKERQQDENEYKESIATIRKMKSELTNVFSFMVKLHQNPDYKGEIEQLVDQTYTNNQIRDKPYSSFSAKLNKAIELDKAEDFFALLKLLEIKYRNPDREKDRDFSKIKYEGKNLTEMLEVLKENSKILLILSGDKEAHEYGINIPQDDFARIRDKVNNLISKQQSSSPGVGVQRSSAANVLNMGIDQSAVVLPRS